ncbi:MAG: penicillin-binding protein 1A [Prolixibacteraceae bacterium]
MKYSFNAFVLFMILGGLFFMLVFLGILGPVPSKSKLQKINNPIASEVFSADGKLLGRYYLENRSNVEFEEISPNVINALIATEDARFYEHRGIDEMALLRVFVKSILLQDHSAGGGSTLSQQIAKNLFPRVDYGIVVNKLREAIIAYRLERIYSKEEILSLYLNTVPFGENIFGIEVASERFFSKPPHRLDIHEAAVLVGMLKANTYYNPRRNPEGAKGRRNVVIEQMAKYDYLTDEEAELFKSKPLDLNYRVISYNEGPAPYFLEMMKPELLEWCLSHTNEEGKPYNLYTDGLKISTTLDYNLQYYAELSVKEYMKRLQQVFDNHWKNRDIFAENPDIITTALLNQTDTERTSAGLISDKVLQDYQKKIKTKLFTWDGLKDTTITRLDSLKHYKKLLNTGFIALEPQTGSLKAWVGGIDFRFFKYDHIKAPRQTGSIFKPLVYLSALENGVEPDTYFTNELKVYKKYQDWAPRNSHNEYGGFYTMKGALAKSINTVSVEILLEAGLKNTIEIAHDLGISADLPRYPSLALGVASISLKEMMEAYAGIVNDGKPVQTHYLVQISNRDNEVLEVFEHPVSTRPVVSPENTRAVIQMMEAVVDNGTGRAIRTVYDVDGDFAGKTGTTQNNSDGWFVGLTPNLVAGCWVGADDPRVHFRTTTYGQGAYMALPIVGKFFHKTYRDPKFESLQNSRFPLPGPEMLAQLNQPQYREMLELEERGFNLADIFRKREQKAEEESGLSNSRKNEEENAKQKGNFWSKVKGIFKKKDK